MSILPHPIKPLNKLHNQGHHRRPRLANTIVCAAMSTTTVKPKHKSNKLAEPQLVPSLKTSVTSRPSSSSSVINDLSLKSTWSHRAWVTSGCIAFLVPLARSVTGAVESHIWLEPIMAGLVGYVLADLGSGVYHWGIDNYGNESTPVFGAQIEAFQGHHKWPWTITRRQFANNLHALARTVTFVVVPLNFLCDDNPILQAFVGACSGCIMFSQQFHAWAHGTKSKLPPLVVAMQDTGLLVSRSQHGAHHRAPYNGNYCIVNGIWNEFLDENKVFEAMEMVLFMKFGLRPRSWSEPSSEWIEESEILSSDKILD